MTQTTPTFNIVTALGQWLSCEKRASLLKIEALYVQKTVSYPICAKE